LNSAFSLSIRFRDQASTTPIVEKYRESGVYGFARDGVGYFITNVFDTQEMSVSVPTTLPDGEYVNLIDGEKHQVVGGELTATLPPMSAIALLVSEAKD
jgi:hypothetical protein